MVYWGELGKCSNIRCPDEGSCMSFYPQDDSNFGNALPMKCVCGCRGNQHVRLDSVPEAPSKQSENVPPAPPRTSAVCLNLSIYLVNQMKNIKQDFPMPAPKATAFPDIDSMPPGPGNKNPPSEKTSFLNISQERSRRQAAAGSGASTGRFNVSSKVSCIFSLLY